MRIRKKEDPNRDIIKRLDILIVILLAQQGIGQRDIAKILHVSTRTIQSMFPGLLTKFNRNENK